MRIYLLVLLLFCAWKSTQAQTTGHEIKVRVDGYTEQQMFLANHLGDNQYITDSTVVNAQGEFIFSGEEALPGGIYLLVLLPENDIIQILIDQEQHFQVHTSRDTPAQSMKIQGSKLNTEFYDYLNFLGRQRVIKTGYNEELKAADSAGDDEKYNSIVDKINALTDEVSAYQNAIVQKDENNFLSKIITSNTNSELPDFSQSDDPEYDRYIYIKNHWFDNIDLGDPRFLRTPVMYEKIDYYLEKLTFKEPDSLIAAVDFILEKTKPAPASYKYYLIHFLNKYAKSNIVGLDAVYVHLGDNYFSTEKTPWADSTQLAKIKLNVSRLKPLLIGKIAPDLKLQLLDIDKTIARKDEKDEHKRHVSEGEITLKGLDAEYTVLFIWSPTCPHCKESLPFLVEFYEKWKDKGVEVVSLCNAIYKNMPTCAEYIKEKNMIKWVNAMDPYVKSKYKKLYDVRTTPQLYVLDREGKIILKKAETSSLDQFFQDLTQERP